MKLDTITLVETPEGTDLQAELVGLVPRALAYTLDLLIRLLVMLVFGIVFGLMGKAGEGFYLILFFVLEWGYPVYFEVFRGGQTWGKKKYKIKVVNDDLTPITFAPSLTRNLLRTADFFPAMYVCGCISVLVTGRFQRLGDLAAGTIVVYDEQDSYNTLALEGVKPVAPLLPLNQERQMAFINFALNRGQMSQSRQNEIADTIRPRMPLNTTDPSSYVRGVGKWLLGAK